MKKSTIPVVVATLFASAFFCLGQVQLGTDKSSTEFNNSDLYQEWNHINNLHTELKMQRAALITQYGEDHPRIMAINSQLLALRSKLASLPKNANALQVLGKEELASMSDAKLRETVGILVERLLRLETEVRTLKDQRLPSRR